MIQAYDDEIILPSHHTGLTPFMNQFNLNLTSDDKANNLVSEMKNNDLLLVSKKLDYYNANIDESIIT